MKDYISNIKLDFMSIRSKRMLILFLALLLFFIFFDIGMGYFILPLVFGLQPFAQEDYSKEYRNEFNNKRVISRYLFALILLVFTIILTAILSVLFVLITGDSYYILLTLQEAIVMTGTFILIISLLFPIYFKNGFVKSNKFLYLVILIYAILIGTYSLIPGLKTIIPTIWSINLFILVPVLIVISSILLILSIKLSIKHDRYKLI